MVYEILVGLGVAFGYPLGSLLGGWTQDEGRNIRSRFGPSLKRLSLFLPIVYAGLLYLFWAANQLEFGALLVFGTIMVQTSLISSKKMDKSTMYQGILFLLIFSVIVFVK